jgi:hypothetical protein
MSEKPAEHVVFDAVRVLVQTVYGPYRRPVRVIVVMDDGEQLRLPVPLVATAAPTAEPPFIPTDSQSSILTALEGRALTTDALANRAGIDRSTLFRRPGGLHELRELGLVSHRDRLGFYRPDMPPPGLDE